MSRFVQSLANWVCVDVTSSIGASPSSALSSRGICQEEVVRRPKVISEDFLKLALRRAVDGRLSEVSSEKSCLNEMAAVIGLVGCAGSVAVIGWIPCLLLQLVVRMQTPYSAVWFGGEDADPMLLGGKTDPTSPLG